MRRESTTASARSACCSAHESRAACGPAVRLRRLARDEQGMSVVLALVFMLICLLLGSVILAAATANASKSGNRTGDRQALLALSSAGQVIADGLGDMKYTHVEYGTSVKSSDCGSTDSAVHPLPDGVAPSSSEFTITNGNEDVNAALKDSIKDMAEEKHRNGVSSTPNSKTLSITSDKLTADRYVATAVLSMDKDYNLTITLSLPTVGGSASAGTGGVRQCDDVRLTYQATVTDLPGTETFTHTYTDAGAQRICSYVYSKSSTTVTWASTPVVE